MQAVIYKIGHISDKIETYNVIRTAYLCRERSNFVFSK